MNVTTNERSSSHQQAMDSIKIEDLDYLDSGDDSWFDNSSFRHRSNTWPVAPKSDPFGSDLDANGEQATLASQCLDGSVCGDGSQLTLTSLNNSNIALSECCIPTTANDVSLSVAIGASNGDICGAISGQSSVNGSVTDLVGLGGKKNTSRRNAWGNMSYADLITQAINSSPDRRLTLSQIYDWMVQNVPYFKDKGDSNSSAGWKVNYYSILAKQYHHLICSPLNVCVCVCVC